MTTPAHLLLNAEYKVGAALLNGWRPPSPVTPDLFTELEVRHLVGAVNRLTERGDPVDRDSVEVELHQRGNTVAAAALETIQIADTQDDGAREYNLRLLREAAADRRRSEVWERIGTVVQDGENPTTAALLQSLVEDYSRAEADGTSRRTLAPPVGVLELLSQPEPDDDWLLEELLPADGNFLLAGYPKTHKTNLILELLVALAIAGKFLGRFQAPRRFRVGAILMEDRPHRVRRRLRRICQGHRVKLEDLDGHLFIWFRPALRLSDASAMRELAAFVADCGLDYLHIDNWAYVSTGNSNDADEVTPQLSALSGLRAAREQGMTVGLTQHARKTTKDVDADRLTDMIRNSSAFGAWYDAGIVLARENETAPVTVRAELRDHPSPNPFAFTVEDEFPAGQESGRTYPSGYLRLMAADRSARQITDESTWQRLVPEIRTFLTANPGASKRKLRDAIGAKNDHIEAAFAWMITTGEALFDPPEHRGQAGGCYLKSPTVPDRAPTVPRAHSEGTVPHRAPDPYVVGGTSGHTSAPSAPTTEQKERGTLSTDDSDALEEGVFDEKAA